MLEDEGIELVDSTTFLGRCCRRPGVLTRRAPDQTRIRGHRLRPRDRAANRRARLGQTVVMRDRACVAVEAMEGTDETIERAARIVAGQRLVVVKVSKPAQDMRFDVPVVGLRTVEAMRRSNATALAIDAGKHFALRSRRADRRRGRSADRHQAFAPASARCRQERSAADERAESSSRGRGGRGRFWPQPRARLPRARRRELVGVVDSNLDRARKAAAEFGCEAIADLAALTGRVDAASVAVPTVEHARIGCQILEQGIDVLVEKPIAASLAEADALIAAARRGNRILQVGHLERFNPAVVAAEKLLRGRFILKFIGSECLRRAAWILMWCTT